MKMKADVLIKHLVEQEVKVIEWEMTWGEREGWETDWAGVKNMKQNKL